MAIALDTSTNGSSGTGTSLTFAHTCSGSNRVLFVAVSTNTNDNTDYITGVTYGGDAMTQVNTFRSPGKGGHELYILVAPKTGANNVVISASGSVEIYGVAASYTGALQTGQPDSNNGGVTDPATSLAVSTTTVANNCWVISSAGQKATAGATLSASTGVTSRKVNGYVAIGDSNGPQAIGAYSSTWGISASTGIGVIAASIAPAPDTAGFLAIL